MSSSKHIEESKQFITSTASSNITSLSLRPHHLTDFEAYQLSTDTQAILGAVEDDVDHAHHTVSSKLIGRAAFVYFTDDPARYEIVKGNGDFGVLTPAGRYSEAKGTVIHIDPRHLSNPRQQLPVIRVEDARKSEPVDGRASKSKSGGTFPQQKAGGGNASHGKGQTSGQDVGDSSRQKGSHPATHASYNKGIEDAPDRRTKLPPVVMGARTFLAIFPKHTQWPGLAYRLLRHGWRANDIAKAQLYPRGMLEPAEFKRRKNAMRHQLRTAVKLRYPNKTPVAMQNSGHPEFQPFVADSSGNENLYNVTLPLPASGTPPVLYEPPRDLGTAVAPAKLSECLRGVDLARLPTGEDEDQFAKVLRWAATSGQLEKLTTEDVPSIIAQLGFTAPSEAQTTQWDVYALLRLRATIADP